MPGFDGTGPQGKGPMTGRAMGFCILKESKDRTGQVEGFAGLQSVPVSQKVENSASAGKDVIDMPAGDGIGPAGLGPMTGRAAGFCTGYPVLGYMNPAVRRGGFYGRHVPAFVPYGAGSYGYGASFGVPYGGWVNLWLRRGFGLARGFGRGWGRGRGRGRFGYWW
jgi:hypothetical protein